jgi:AraC family transcriptional regulator of adaptative response / DNA-3-methyladenine glycosylase II
MELDPRVCYRALRTRDARFDGRFFTAVRTTGVFCRPVCPARTPRAENCQFFSRAAAAQEAGYRPCLRCRPEASPGTPAWLGTSTTVSRALRLIEDGALDTGGVADLADRLGIGERHLRRLFAEHVGASPGAVARMRRVFFAKNLLHETALPMTAVAHAAGFRSVRRFNDAMQQVYGRCPRELRRSAPTTADAASATTIRLAYHAPYDWDAVAGFLGARATRGVESVSRDTYRRTFALHGTTGWLEVRPAGDASQLVARIRVTHPRALMPVAERLRRLFDLEAEPGEIGAQLAKDGLLRDRLRRLPGVRVPGAWDGFELAVRAVLGQQVSVAAATGLAGRIVDHFGEKLPAGLAPGSDDEVPDLIFPTPEVLAEANVAVIGMPVSRARAIGSLARAVARGELDLSPSADGEETRRRLLALPGIGPWTAEYVAMRALREPDAFPATDLGLCRALDRAPSALSTAAQAWRPWRAYAAMLLWLATERSR